MVASGGFATLAADAEAGKLQGIVGSAFVTTGLRSFLFWDDHYILLYGKAASSGALNPDYSETIPAASFH